MVELPRNWNDTNFWLRASIEVTLTKFVGIILSVAFLSSAVMVTEKQVETKTEIIQAWADVNFSFLPMNWALRSAAKENATNSLRECFAKQSAELDLDEVKIISETIKSASKEGASIEACVKISYRCVSFE